MFDIYNGYLNEFMSDLESSEFLVNISLGGWDLSQFEILTLKKFRKKNDMKSCIYDIQPMMKKELLGHSFRVLIDEENEGEEITVRYK